MCVLVQCVNDWDTIVGTCVVPRGGCGHPLDRISRVGSPEYVLARSSPSRKPRSLTSVLIQGVFLKAKPSQSRRFMGGKLNYSARAGWNMRSSVWVAGKLEFGSFRGFQGGS